MTAYYVPGMVLGPWDPKMLDKTYTRPVLVFTVGLVGEKNTNCKMILFGGIQSDEKENDEEMKVFQ